MIATLILAAAASASVDYHVYLVTAPQPHVMAPDWKPLPPAVNVVMTLVPVVVVTG